MNCKKINVVDLYRCEAYCDDDKGRAYDRKEKKICRNLIIAPLQD